MYVQLVGEHIVAGSTRPGIAWTFGIIENDTPNAVSTPGGYVLVTTGLLRLMQNEAQLAGVLGHEIGHVTGRHAILSYAKAKASACNVAVTGYYLVEAGASNIPGGEEFVKNAKFGKTMKAFARPEGVDMDKDKDVDVAFMQWFTNQVINVQNLFGNAEEDEFDADKTAFDLMAAAGYDTKEYDKLIDKIPNSLGAFSHHPSNSDRIEALQKLRSAGEFGSDGGKAPAIPSNVAWPKPAA
jgi:predicted Zn-dependent protease